MSRLSFETSTDRPQGSMPGLTLPLETEAPLDSVAADCDDSCAADKRLSENVLQAIVGGNYSIHSVRADCHHGNVYLSGFVSSWHHKQLVQESVRAVPGVQLITNGILVESGDQLLK